jgi:hypothetical protein
MTTFADWVAGAPSLWSSETELWFTSKVSRFLGPFGWCVVPPWSPSSKQISRKWPRVEPMCYLNSSQHLGIVGHYDGHTHHWQVGVNVNLWVEPWILITIPTWLDCLFPNSVAQDSLVWSKMAIDRYLIEILVPLSSKQYIIDGSSSDR